MAYLASYLKEEKIDVGIKELNNPSDELARAIRIYQDEPPIRRVIERMLYERCGIALIEEALYHKFKESISKPTLRKYKKFFYDVDTMNNYEVAKYYESIGERAPAPAPVPGHLREEYIAFKNGLETNVSPKQIMNHILQHTFFRAQELAQHGWVADDKVLKYQKAALDVIKTMNDGELKEPIPEEFMFEIEYPQSTAVDVAELEGYNPEENPNEE